MSYRFQAPGRDTLVVVLAFATQVTVIAVTPLWPAAIAAAAAVALTTHRVHSLRPVWALVRTFGMLLAFVLVARLAVEPTIGTARQWVDYAVPLFVAALVAQAAVYLLGTARFGRAAGRIIRLVPGRSGRAMGDIAEAALLTLPYARRCMSRAREAARVRLAPRSRSLILRTRATATGTVSVMYTVPRRRGEAMLVRGLLAHTPE